MSDSKSIYDTCWYCQIQRGKANVKRCGGCRMVWYCSKECQKKAWPTHKIRCSTGADLWNELADDPEAITLHKALTKWVPLWRPVLFNYAVWALDIANHGRERLSTHTVWIELESRPNSPSKTQRFGMTKGELMSQAEFVNSLRNVGAGQEKLNNIESMRGTDTVQVAMLCNGSVFRLFWFQLRDNGEWCAGTDPESSSFLAKVWPILLRAVIDSGDTNMTMEATLAQDSIRDALVDIMSHG